MRDMPILVSPSAKKAWDKAVSDRSSLLQVSPHLAFLVL